jgi:hypothetical protein
MPLVTVLPILQPLLLAFAAVLTKPQRRHFDNYIQALVCQDHRRTLAGMSRHVLDGPDASAWDRFVTSDAWELPAVNQRWLCLLRAELQRAKPQGLRIAGRQTAFLAFDDTHQRRTGKQLEGAGFHFDHTAGHSVWSHSLVLGVYRTGDYTFPYSGEAYVRETDLAALNALRERENLLRDPAHRRPVRPFRSKIELVVAQLEAFRPLQADRQTFVLFDSWYLNERIVQAARRKGLDWCSVLKANRVLELLELSLETGEVRVVERLSVEALLQHFPTAAMLTEAGIPLPEAAPLGRWQAFRVGERTFRGVSYRARLAGIGVVQVVCVQERYRGGRWSPWVPLVTNRLELTACEVVTVYLQRWPVEVLIRDGKQNLGLVDGQIERLEGTVRHWLLSLLSLGMLTLLRLQAESGALRTASGQPVTAVGKTVGEVREYVKQCALAELIRWTCAQTAAGLSVEEILLRLRLTA